MKSPTTVSRQQFGAVLHWIAQRTWRSGPSLFIGLVISTITVALLPAALTVLLGLFVQSMESAAAPGGLAGRAYVLLAVVALLLVVQAISSAVRHYCHQRLGDELQLNITSEITEHAATLDLSQFEDSHVQDQLHRAIKSPGKGCLSLLSQTLAICSDGIQLVSLFCVLFWIEPLLTGVLLLLGLPLLLLRSHVANLRHRVRCSKTTLARWSKYYASKLTNPKAVPTVKVLQLAPLMLERFQRHTRDVLYAMRRTYLIELIGSVACAALFLFGFLPAIAVVASRAMQGTAGVASLVVYWSAATRFRATLNSLGGTLTAEWESALSLSLLLEFLNLSPKIVDTTALAPAVCQGGVEFHEVAFRYPGTDRWVLKGLSFSIAPRETVAIVGHNGAGKTTLVKLLARLYDVESGNIFVDGHDLRDLSLEFLRRSMSVGFQAPVRFEATASENIAFGDHSRLLPSANAVRRIAQSTAVASMIERLPQGFDTMLGRQFGNHDLSGGQWRRLSIARALARDAAILVLDEPTAGLDLESENELYDGLRTLIQQRTTLLISHRFSTIRLADRILVFGDGRIVENGDHERLVQLDGLYARLWRQHLATASMRASPRFARREAS